MRHILPCSLTISLSMDCKRACFACQNKPFCKVKQALLVYRTGSFENQQPHIGVFNHCRTLYVTTPYDGYLSVCLCISAGMLKVDGSQFIASSCPYCGQLATMKRYNIDIRHAIKQAQRCFATHCRDTTTLYEYVQAL